MSSRDLRYAWFKTFLNAGYNYIVTAHHSDDNVETILYNLLKTTGYRGLVGIPKSSNNIFSHYSTLTRMILENMLN